MRLPLQASFLSSQEIDSGHILLLTLVHLAALPPIKEGTSVIINFLTSEDIMPLNKITVLILFFIVFQQQWCPLSLSPEINNFCKISRTCAIL